MLKIQRFVFNLFHENTFIICDEITKIAAVIDPGMYDESEQKAFKAFVNQNSLQLKYCINTHCHIDHILGNAFVKNEFGTELLIPKEDEFLLDLMIADADTYIDQSTKLFLGEIEGTFLSTPGHSPGEFSLYFEKEKVLFSGDVLFKESIGRTDLWGGNYETLLSSIKTKLLVLPDDVKVYPGHESSTTIGHERARNPFLIN